MDSLGINGKIPVAAWVPSLDTDGDGTTTLTDLRGSQDGTLTNMDAATDWVADTGAGGTTALDLDGTNDGIALPTLQISSGWSVSIWFKFDSLSGLTFSFAMKDPQRVYLGQSSGRAYIRVGSDSGDIGAAATLTIGQWHHLVVAIATDGLSYSGWCDGTNFGTRSTTMGTPGAMGIGAFFGSVGSPDSAYADGRFDDLRIFRKSPLVDADVTALWASGSGRGRQVSVGGASFPLIGPGGLVY
jgi:hypothetical protein